MKTLTQSTRRLFWWLAFIYGLLLVSILPALAQTRYVDEKGELRISPVPANALTGGGATTLKTGWYLCNWQLNYTGTITINGDVNLILGDSCDMRVAGSKDNAGINVTDTNSLTISSATGGISGSLTAKGGGSGADIGGGRKQSGGTITINGGTVKASGGAYGGAGIGGGMGDSHVSGYWGTPIITISTSGAGGTITINGGTVNAIGGSNGAGIGGGSDGMGGTTTINGGTINATGGYRGAGIGGGWRLSSDSGGTITINGGTVNATGGSGGAGIGGDGDGGTINITGGTINATGGVRGAEPNKAE